MRYWDDRQGATRAPILAQISIGVRSAFKAWNDNNSGAKNPMYDGIYPIYSRDPHLVL
mgnify:CR=1 FL=1